MAAKDCSRLQSESAELAPLHGAPGQARGWYRPADRKQAAGLEKRRQQAPHSACLQPIGLERRYEKDRWGTPCIEASAILRGGKRAFFRKLVPPLPAGAIAGSPLLETQHLNRLRGMAPMR